MLSLKRKKTHHVVAPQRTDFVRLEEKQKTALTIDLLQLIKEIEKSAWPIPSIEEMFDTLQGSAVFNSIDMSAGFSQVPMGEPSQG